MTAAVLIVEDDPTLAHAIARNLARRNYQVQCAVTVSDAIALLAAGLPSVVLLDVDLPDGSGWEELSQCPAVSRVEHCRQLHDQYQLAELRRRVHHTVYVLLPVVFVYALFLIWQGVPDNLSAYSIAYTLEGATQTIAQGPVASREAIKMFGTNGGGFFNANSAHPFENPTPFSNFVEMLSIFLLGSAMVYMFGKWVKDTRQGWALWAAMFILFNVGYFTAVSFEQNGNHLIASQAHVATVASSTQPGGNMEGKEVRFGISASALFATITTDASCGAINAWHDSFMPIAGLVPLTNMATGEVIFGGVGAGLYGMLMYAILAIFIAGLMVGRTPEYLGKKIESFEVKMASLARASFP